MNKTVLKTSALAGLLALVPFLVGFNNYYVLLATYVLLYAAVATSWNIIGGMGGQLDFAAASYLGIGTFAAGTMITFWKIPFWVTMPAGGLIAAGLATILGYFTFRFGLREVYYALASLASVFVLSKLFLLWEKVGGSVPRYLHVKGLLYMRLDSNLYYYYLLLIMFIAIFIISYYLKNSKLGYFLRTIREDDEAAEALGVDIRKCKLKALIIYAFIIGVLGTINLALVGSYSYTVFNEIFSLTIVVICLVGGLGIVHGPALGAFLLVGAREVLRAQFGSITGLSYIIFGVALVLVMLQKPEGIGRFLRGS